MPHNTVPINVRENRSVNQKWTNVHKTEWRQNDLWNTLPQSVIDAKDVRQFEIRLDKYWEHQDVKFEYKANIQNKDNTWNHTEISYITEEVEVDIVVENQRPRKT